MGECPTLAKEPVQKIQIHTLMEREQKNTIQKIKEDDKPPNTRNIAYEYICCICKPILYFQVFVVFCVLFIGILIVAQLQIENFFFEKMCIITLQI